MAGRRFLQILALLGLLSPVGCAHWCANHYPAQQCCAPCQPCCCQPGYGAAAAPTWGAPATAAPCTCAPVGR
jgi:hypothetical protein